MTTTDHRQITSHPGCRPETTPLTDAEYTELEDRIVAFLTRRGKPMSMTAIVKALSKRYWERDIRCAVWTPVGQNRIHLTEDRLFRVKRENDPPAEDWP